MFNLIVVVVSLALASLITAATVFYGAGAYRLQQAAGKANILMESAEQLKEASALARSEGAAGIQTDLDLLTYGFLQGRLNTHFATEAPSSWQFLDPDTVGSFVLPLAVSGEVCTSINFWTLGHATILSEFTLAADLQCVGTGPLYTVLVIENPYSLASEIQDYEARTGLNLPSIQP